MSYKFTRRSFIKKTSTLGVATLAGSYLLPDLLLAAAEPGLDIASITGKDFYKNTVEAVKMLGGMKKFVAEGARVAILPNAVGKYPATSVNPKVMLAVIEMCFEAGAAEVRLIKGVAENFWEGKEISKTQMAAFKRCIISERECDVLPIEKGVALKEAHICKDLMNADVFINLGLMKHHQGTKFTGMLKNLMGACPHDPTNKFFHFGSNPNAKGFYDDPAFLSQCVADLNLLKKPDLCIADSTEFITSNGPFGPGDIEIADTVTAGLNPVSVDAFCSSFLELNVNDVAMIGMSAKHGLGELDLEKLNIKQETV